MRRYMCGVPKDYCQGAITGANSGLHKVQKMHGSSQDAFKCYSKYLESLGYKKVGSKEFEKPGEPILVLTRKSKFGASMRMGKNLEGKGNRFVPKKGKRSLGGIII